MSSISRSFSDPAEITFTRYTMLHGNVMNGEILIGLY